MTPGVYSVAELILCYKCLKPNKLNVLVVFKISRPPVTPVGGSAYWLTDISSDFQWIVPV